LDHVKNIEIKNFKSIRHQIIDDCRRVNVFIGYPNVGKSNILEAIGLFSMNQEGPFDRTKNPSSPNKFTLNQICRISEPIDLFYDKNYNDKLSVIINKKFAIQLDTPKDFFTLHFKNVLLEENHLVATLVSSMSIDTHDYWIRWHSTPAFREDAIYNRIKIYLGSKNPVEVSNDYLNLNMPYGDNLSQIISVNEDVRTFFIDLLKKNNLKPHIVTGKYGVAKELANGLVVTFDSNLLADTLKRLLLHIAAIKTNKKCVLLFEEPEAHMFPPYIAKFTADIINDENNNQYFIATHSPFVLNDFMEDMDKGDLSIYVVGLRDGETAIRKITEEEITEIYQYGIDLFFNLENYLKDAV